MRGMTIGSTLSGTLARLALLGTLSLWVAGGVAAADPDKTAAASPPSALTPRDAGARYGQALGAIEICHGSKITDKADALLKSYAGADQDTFKAQAAKIFDAWARVKACVDQHDPNKCKIIMDTSCLSAEAEIGAKGSALPGLVDFAPR